jgi:hypothetical protein
MTHYDSDVKKQYSGILLILVSIFQSSGRKIRKSKLVDLLF